MSEKVYVRRLYKAKCDCGTMPNYLNVEKDHGCVWMAQCEDGETQDKKQAFMNACDYEHKKNVIHFGRCNSSTNHDNEVDKEEIIMGALTFGLGLLIKNALGCSGCKCRPIISDAWSEVDDTVLINGVPAITEKSRLYCRNGGVITIEPLEEEE